MATLTIKEQVNGVLVDISCDSIRGLTLRQCYQLWTGKKVVCELIQITGKGYICGTEKARDHYRKGGFKALTFAEALEIQKHAGYMELIVVPEDFRIDGEPLQFEWGQDIGKK